MSKLRKRRWLITLLAILFFVVVGFVWYVVNARSDGAYQVYPGEDIQFVLEAAAQDPVRKHVKVHAGVYRPNKKGQALVWFNQRHEGITLEAIGDVTLSAGNPQLANPGEPSYPACVNHVVYFGDGITSRTVLRGFKITGANNHVIQEEGEFSIQPDISAPGLEKHDVSMSGLETRSYFYTDGGGIKIFGRSYPAIERVEIHDNVSHPCGAGVSIEHRGYAEGAVRFRDCIFRNNRCMGSGAAIDLLPGSSAVIENCLFVGNKSNSLFPDKDTYKKWKPKHGAGALTVFPESKVIVRNCTFTGNRNGADDASFGNIYEHSIFWNNTAQGGWAPGARFEMDVSDAAFVRGCFIQGDTADLNDSLDAAQNVLGCPDPEFDELFRPRAKMFENVGYRPVPTASVSRRDESAR